MLSDSESEEETDNITHDLLQNSISLTSDQLSLSASLPRNFSKQTHSRNSSIDSQISNASAILIDNLVKENDLNKDTQLNIRLSSFNNTPAVSPEVGRKNDVLSDSEKEKLQLYVFVARCIAQPISVKKEKDFQEANPDKLSLEEFYTIKKRFESYLQSETDLILGEYFHNAMKYFHEHCLSSKYIESKIRLGCMSILDLREIFSLRAHHDMMADMLNEVESPDLITENSANLVEQLWLKTFNMTTGVMKQASFYQFDNMLNSKDDYYSYIRQVLGITKDYQHKIIYNACELDKEEEQIAALKRDLTKQKQIMQNPALAQEFTDYDKGLRYLLNKKHKIMTLLQQQEKDDDNVNMFTKKFNLLKSHQVMSIEDGSTAINKDFFLSQNYTIKVSIHEGKGLSFLGDKDVFVLMELPLDKKAEKFRTDPVSSDDTIWDSSCEWAISYPCASLRLSVAVYHTNPLHISDEKEMAKFTFPLHCTYNIRRKWYTMTSDPSSTWFGPVQDDVEGIRLCVSVEYKVTDNSVKTAGLLNCRGEKNMLKWKKRFMVLAKASDFAVALCAFKPYEVMPSYVFNMDDYNVDNVDFIDKKDSSSNSENETEEANQYNFKLMKEGEEILFQAKSYADQLHWISKLYLSTGQSYKPLILDNPLGSKDESKDVKDMDRALKHGLGGIIHSDPFDFDQNKLLEILLGSILEHRSKDSTVFRGEFGENDKSLLKDYCTRYNVRECFRFICYLKLLLNYAMQGHSVTPKLIHFCYSFIMLCAFNNGEDEASTITKNEIKLFDEAKDLLMNYLEQSIINFRSFFPCGFSTGNLLSVIKLYKKMLNGDKHKMNDPDNDLVKASLNNCLKRAALVNYINLSSQYNIQDLLNDEHLKVAEAYVVYTSFTYHCISEADELRSYHAKVITYDQSLFVRYHQYYWSLYSVDLIGYLRKRPINSFECIKLFQIINQYCLNHASIRLKDFHECIIKAYRPIIFEYMATKKILIQKTVKKNLEEESYEIHRMKNVEENDDKLYTTHCFYMDLKSLKDFIQLLDWPHKDFNEVLWKLVEEIQHDMLQSIAKRLYDEFTREFRERSITMEFIIPEKCCIIINELCNGRATVSKSKRMAMYFDDLLNKAVTLAIERLTLTVLSVLKKLSFYDHGSCTVKLAKIWKPKHDLASQYFQFITMNARELRHAIKNETYRTIIGKNLWLETCLKIDGWLTERKDIPLHLYQLHVLTDITRAVYEMMRNHIEEQDIENEYYKEVKLRLDTEEAVNSLEEDHV